MQTALGISLPVPYPPVPIVSFDDAQQEHPVLFRLSSAVMPFTSSLALTSAPGGRERRHPGPLLRQLLADGRKLEHRSTRAVSAGVGDERAKPGPFPLIVGIEGKLRSAFSAAVSSPEGEGEGADIDAPEQAESDVRVLVAGTSSFLRDEFMPPPQQGGEQQLTAALSLALNAVDWLAAESDLIAIRAKNVEDPALEVPTAVSEAEDAAHSAAQEGDEEGVDEALEQRTAALEAWDNKKFWYKALNWFGIPILFALFGVLRWRMRAAKKKNLKL